jgi:hypothetical protein
MKLKNYQLKYLIELLSALTLKGKQSRMRTKFLKPLCTYYNEEVLSEFQNLQTEYAFKDENGDIIYIDEEKTQFNVKEEFLEHEQELWNEEYIIDLTDSNKMALLSISEILLEGEFEVSGEIAAMYDIWCEEAEKVVEFYEGE